MTDRHAKSGVTRPDIKGQDGMVGGSRLSGHDNIRWPHGFRDWRWNRHLMVFEHAGVIPGHDYWCLGDRMFHGSFGRDSGDLVYHGSYANNWHGGIQTRNFFKAIEWLHEANGESDYWWSK